jgi:5-hydroxyisourate hydrolase
MSTPASLTTHVLDLASGRPAAGMRVELYRIEGEAEAKLTEIVTNDDGRSTGPIIARGTAVSGVYELRFHVEDYLRTGRTPPFLGVVPIRFGLDAQGGHYHVPLLVSPFGYSTYRGS